MTKGLFCIIILILLIVGVHLPVFVALDQSISLHIYDFFHSSLVDTLFGLVTDYTLGTIWGLGFVMLVFLVIRNYRAALIFAGGAISSFVLADLIKILVQRPRPFLVLSQVQYLANSVPIQYSFPSGHTTLAFFSAYFLIKILKLNKLQSVALYILAVLIGISRIYLGAHYVADVIAGAACGTLVAIVSVAIYQKLRLR